MEIDMRREPAHRRGCDDGIDQKIGRREVEAGAQRALQSEPRHFQSLELLGREVALAKAKLEESVMWAVKGITR